MPNKVGPVGLVGFVLVATLFTPAPSSGQEQGGSIQGVVKDASGGVLPGVTVEVRSPTVVGVNTAVTDAQGAYRFPALPPGSYELTATLPGFTPAKVENIVLALGQILKIDLTMSIAAVAETVHVTGESPLIDVKQNATFQTIEKDFIDRLPKGRDFTSVVSVAPGALDESRAGGIQIDGSSGSENRFIVDGMDTTSLRTGTSSKTVLTDFIQEVQVKSSGYAAEYGGSTGGVVSAITRSGSNVFHGSGGGYYRTAALRGDIRGSWRINPFDNRTAEFVYTPDDGWHWWNPIGDLGGPLLRDKFWFFAGYSREANYYERSAIFRNSPPPYERRTFNWWSRDDYLNWNLTTQFTNNIRLKVAGANQRGRSRGSAPGLQPNGSKFIDGTPTDGFTTAAWDSDPEAFKDRWERTGSDSLNDLYSSNLDWVLTPKLYVNLASGYYVYDSWNPKEFAGDQIRHSFSASNIGMAGVPASLQFPSGYVDNKSTSRTVTDRYGRFYINANTTWFSSWKGEHMFKAGMRFERLTNEVNSGNQQPTISLYWGLARSTLDGRSVRGQYGYYTVTRGVVRTGDVASNNIGLWLQDSWTIGSRLTVNAGVRGEKERVPSYRPENPGLDFDFGEKIAPRVGFAYDVRGDSRWKVYGSYGKYFDITKLEMPRGSLGGEHWITYYWTLDTYDWPAINCQEGATGCPGTFIEQVDYRHPANAIDPALTAYFGEPRNTLEPHIRPVESGEIIFGFDHELARTMSAGVRYVHKWLERTIEDVGVSVPGVGEVYFIANPGFGVAKQILPPPTPPQPPAVRDYDALEFRVRKRPSDNWSFQASYVLSRLWGNYSGLASSDEAGRTSPNVNRFFDALYMSYNAKGQANYGRLGTDRPHNFKAQVTYDTPWGTSVGVDMMMASGIPFSSQLSWKGYPVYFNGRGDMGRTPTLSEVDLFLQHDFRLPRGHRFNVNVNVSNLFDQKTVTSFNNTPFRDSFNKDDAYFFAGFDPYALAAEMRAQGRTMRDNPLYKLPGGFQGRREIRLGVKYIF